MSLCQYKNALGVPGQGIHSFRIFDIAFFDVLLTCALAYLINYVGKFESYGIVLFCTFLAGIFLHWLFCVETTVQKFLKF